MYTDSIDTDLCTEIGLYSDEIKVDFTLYEPEYKKTEVAKTLNCSVRTVERYLYFGFSYIPEFKEYFNSDGTLNGKRIRSSHVVFLEEIQDLKSKFSHDRVCQILTRKYQQGV